MLLKTVSVVSLVASSALAHMTFIHPCARYSPDSWCPNPPAGEDVDWDMTTSIGSEGQAVSPICKHTKPYDSPVATWTPGTTQNIEFSDGNGHQGGHCQFSISYDGGQTFVVLSETLKHCFYNGPSDTDTPSVLSFNVPLPANLPGTDHAVFAWTWVNASGNREFYMNCADIAITGPAGSYTGKKMTILNYPGYPVIPEFLDDYTTGLSYYTNATQVTVTGSGYSGSGNSGSNTSSTTKSTSIKSSATSTTKATSSAPTSGSCNASSNGAYTCVDSGASGAYHICNNGTMLSASCPAGTVCKQSSSSIYCDFA
ncbi:hypothetical protein H4R99_005566 [Coemansia sp. RSA 1722]|nr:hypothetical protein IWW45_006666 [Coemansia sp. RSA 485]KAJ2594915.1 hypothetical protein H4R99_005566 [Coemansia sp. RSA 1722]